MYLLYHTVGNYVPGKMNIEEFAVAKRWYGQQPSLSSPCLGIVSNPRPKILPIRQLQPRARRALAPALRRISPPVNFIPIVFDREEDDDGGNGNGGRERRRDDVVVLRPEAEVPATEVDHAVPTGDHRGPDVPDVVLAKPSVKVIWGRGEG